MTDTASTTPDEEPVDPAPPADVPDTPNPSDEPAAAEPAAVAEPLPEQPEPTIVGYGVVQDNVTDPEAQVTQLPDGTETGRHTTEDASAPPAPLGAPEADQDDAEVPA